MGISTARAAFRDCEEAFNKAVEAERGCRIRVSDHNAAVNLRMRLHQCRELDRKESRRVLEETPEHPMYGSSEWDGLVCRIREVEDGWWVYLEKRTAGTLEIEEITEATPLVEHRPTPQIEHEPIKLIAGPTVQRRRV